MFSYNAITPDALGDVLDQVQATENTPPLYYLLAWASARLGDPTVWLRLPSVVLGAMAVVPTWFLARRAAGREAAAIAVALVGVLPFAVLYGSEARAYATAMFMVPASTVCMLRALDGRGKGWWFGYWAFATLALYSHYTTGLAIALQAVWALAAVDSKRRETLAANAAVVLAFVPLLAMVGRNAEALDYIGVIHPLTLHGVISDSVQVTWGDPLASRSQVPGNVAVVLLAAAVAIGCAALLIGRGAVRPTAEPRRRRERNLFLLLGFGPMALLLAVSLVSTSIYLSRNLIYTVPYLCLLIASLISSFGRRASIAIATLVIGAALLGTVRMLADYGRPDFRGVAERIESSPEGTVVYVRPTVGNIVQQNLDLYLGGTRELADSIPRSDELMPGQELWAITAGDEDDRSTITIAGTKPLSDIRLDGATDLVIQRVVRR